LSQSLQEDRIWCCTNESFCQSKRDGFLIRNA
jgi:hypothetical protein